MGIVRKIINTAKQILPKSVFTKLKPIKIKLYYEYIRIRYKFIAHKLKRKEKIKVAFFLIHESVWKYEGVYKLMDEDERFEPVVVVCPYIVYGEEIMLSDMNQAYITFKNKGYNVIKTLNEQTGKWLDVKAEIKPDIVFFTNPWRLTKSEYLIYNYLDKLTCYVPYFFHVTKHLKENYGGELQNLVWKAFYETNIHYDFAKKISLNLAKNVIVSGYPGLDPFLFDKTKYDSSWKIKDNNTKKIIWAPHHTIEGQDAGLGFSNFKKYAHYFLQLIELYSTQIQFAFKPHPLLKPKLYKDAEWGYDLTNDYFKKWDTYSNAFLVDGSYVDLFTNSDALIHDSGSFTVEYIAVNKPVLYTLSTNLQLESLNDFGKMAIEQHYLAYNIEQITEFIDNVVIQNNDTMKSKRTDFITKHLLPPNNISASENIYNEIIKSI